MVHGQYGTTFEGIAGVTRTIKNLLDQHNVPVHVEVRENTLHGHGASSCLTQHQNVPTLEAVVQDNKNWMVNGGNHMTIVLNEMLLPLLSTLGWEMARTTSKSLYEYGTAEPFVSLDGSSDLFALTCSHVLKPTGESPVDVSQGSWCHFDAILKYVKGKQDRFESRPSNMELLAKVESYKAGDRPEVPSQEELVKVDNYLYVSAIFDALMTIYDDVKSRSVVPGSGLKKRMVGHVYAWPEYLKDAQASGVLSDWTLVQLDKSKFTKPRNKDFVGDANMMSLLNRHDSMPALPYEQQEAIEKEIYSNNGFIRMNGKVASIQDDIPKEGKSGIPCSRVLKRGAKTGFSLGATNSIEACVRASRFNPEVIPGVIPGKETGSSYLCRWELLVIPFINHISRIDETKGIWHTCFSSPGDSGAAVLDPSGTFIGQVVSGSGPAGLTFTSEPSPEDPQLERPLQAPMDVTFVLMAGQIMAEIERTVGKKPLLMP
ncbi:hypothetical protein PGQ11_013343 [Apiospora arundinis]|uniref:Uncharacterized protein n=1 Tax=Apiospora arundinis TaxID=335852 RepID=A0ABR2HPQ5_9PEZI